MYWQRLLQLWSAQWQERRLLLVVAGIVAAASVLGIGYLVRSNDVPLFVNALDANQLSEVDGHLAQWGTAHHSVDGTMLVNATERNSLLLRLAWLGSPHPHIATSDETLAKLGALTPDSVFQAQARAGNAGDLALGLRGIEGVTDASVVLAPAVQQVFNDQPTAPASAAVRLSLRPDTRLSAIAIDGIRHFIASGVPGLSPEHITLLDDHGNALESATTRDDGDALRLSLQSAFDEVFGAGATIVRVHIRYDAAAHSEHEVRRVPVSGPTLSSNGSIERLHDRQRSYEHREFHDERGTLLHEEITQTSGGRPMAMTVAVFVDQSARIDLERLRSLAVASAGLDLQHGDVLAIEPMHFSREQVFGKHPDPTTPFWLYATVSSLLCGGFVLLGSNAVRRVFRFVRSANWKKLSPKVPIEVPEKNASATATHLHRLLAREPLYMAAAVLGRLPPRTAASVLALYSEDDRRHLEGRMTKPVPAYLGDWEQLIESQPR